MNKKLDNNSFRKTNRFQLDRVAFYGRTLSEYLKMFRIDDTDHLKRYNRILDCPSGASSFVAEANNKYGVNTVGCDPLFDKDSRILQKQGEEDIEYVVKRVSLVPNLPLTKVKFRALRTYDRTAQYPEKPIWNYISYCTSSI